MDRFALQSFFSNIFLINRQIGSTDDDYYYYDDYSQAYLIFVIFFTLAKFLENKIYTEKRQFFALNL